MELSTKILLAYLTASCLVTPSCWPPSTWATGLRSWRHRRTSFAQADAAPRVTWRP